MAWPGTTPRTSQHDASSVKTISVSETPTDWKFTYHFHNFFHPYVGELIARLNRWSLSGMLDPTWLESLHNENFFRLLYSPTHSADIAVQPTPKKIDVSPCGPYSNYNWELFFHIPLMVAVHLSKAQRFAEAQRWFHFVFDPTSNEETPDPLKRFWKFLAFREPGESMRIEDIVRVLSTPAADLPLNGQCRQDSILESYGASREKPFQPHVIARTRPLAYQYSVVMKYLDNLIRWGDHLFQQDTPESINHATQVFVLAANNLGARPQQIPPFGKVRAKSFKQLQLEGLGPIGNALVDLEGQFPFNLTAPDPIPSDRTAGGSSPLFGVGRALYFCVPRNDKLLGYWDTVADRLFKIRHCMNIAGVVRPLALFDPPLDPGMLVKAAAAGIDVGSIVSGLNQPVGPVRCLVLIQKALELCGEVRGLGNALLSALEKGDAEHLALVRQRHEIQIQQMAQEVRFLQWKQAQEATTSLLTPRKTAMQRFHYYQRLLGLPADPNAPDDISLKRSELNEDNFDEIYSALVEQYGGALGLQKLPNLRLAGKSSPGILSGYSGDGRVYLTENEDTELNTHLPAARDLRLVASAANLLAAALMPIPSVNIDAHYWGIGADSKVTSGEQIAAVSKFTGDVAQIIASWEQDQAGMASRYASYERRADEWLFQYNLAALELMQIGRQILTSLISEQIAHHEYLNIQQQIKNAEEVDEVLHSKFTNEDLYLWMQGEVSRLYYEYYRFAFDTARKAERTMKQELMRPELDGQDFVKFNYWDGGRKGLLSGESLYLDVKRMEMAYHENNKRELELTKHVSLRQLNPVALLALKSTGTCQVTIPEWYYDRDVAGHYMRRLKTVGLSIASVVGPYTSLNCTLSLLKSTVRKSPLLKDGLYARQEEDDRFLDYVGAAQSIVTSTGQNDSGMFETNLHDERILPFEGEGAESTWKLELPTPEGYPVFDYATISDVILHVRYTARQGVEPRAVRQSLDDLFEQADQAGLALLFSIRHDFPREWSLFSNGTGDFSCQITKDYFPYFAQGKSISLTGLEVYDGTDVSVHSAIGEPIAATAELESSQAFTVLVPRGVMPSSSEAFLIVRYSLR